MKECQKPINICKGGAKDEKLLLDIKRGKGWITQESLMDATSRGEFWSRIGYLHYFKLSIHILIISCEGEIKQ